MNVMILSVRNFALTLGIFSISIIASAQKKNETSAAVEFKNKYRPALATQDVETAKKALIAAKEFIDLAAAHPDTESSQKTLWLKGEIYAHFMILGMQTMDTNFIKLGGEDAIDVSIEAFKKGYGLGNKMKSDFENSVDEKAGMLNGYAGMLYEAGQFGAAAELYETIYKYRMAINELDSASLFNASLCYEKVKNYEKAAEGYEKLADAGYKGTSSAIYAARAYQELGNTEKAISIINKARETNGSDRDLLLELVNMNIAAGDAAGAEKALNDAIATDPNNKQLHYTIGTIYIDLKENAKAEAAIEKALAIDPDYVDAQYQLGAHLFNWANDLMLEANSLKIGDPKFNELKDLSDQKMDKSLSVLEKYIVNDPNNKAILTILYQANHKRGNSEKALEYKKRLDSL